MEYLYGFGWIIVFITFIYSFKNRYKVGDEDYDTNIWIATIISVVICIVVLLIEIAVSIMWLFEHVKII